ncbi:DUF2877 domain-containing protein [Streptomyces sp. Da 82-17]|uniref:DUF2877 domain-containing protein n=1 Tax=Streptomyces sp. Da 82-17 TaxID=3377116 RepID=UPI0038D4B5C3
MRTSEVLRTHSGDAALLARLRGLDGHGRVESVFRGVLNLQLPDDGLITLAARGRDDAPRTLVVDVPHWGGSGVRPGAPVAFAPDSVRLTCAAGDIRVCVRDAAGWDPIVPSLDRLTPADLATAARALHQVTYTHGELGGMLGAPPTAGPMETAVCAALDHGRRRLIRAVRSRSGTESEAVLALLGLGPGLTPAGDDFLTGLALLSALDGSGLGPFAAALGRVLAQHPGRTTLLSATTLREALSGRVRAPLVDVLHALAATRGHGEAQAVDIIRSPVRRALAHGHTSGADTLSGLVTGLHLERELRGSL